MFRGHYFAANAEMCESDNSQNMDGLVLSNQYIPVELLVNILSNIDPSTLVECRKVCKSWKTVIDNQVWHYKVIKEHCRTLSDRIRINTSRASWRDLYLFCKKLPIGRNLILNSCGQEKLQNWTILSNGGNRWAVEKTPVGAYPFPEASHFGQTSCFATSYHSCSKRQTIDLESEGLSTAFLDAIQPTIRVSEWFAGRYDCGSVYELKASLLNEDQEVITSFSVRETVKQWQGGAWEKVEHEFLDYGPGVCYVEFFHGGMDTLFWTGHYGSKMAGACVIVEW